MSLKSPSGDNLIYLSSLCVGKLTGHRVLAIFMPALEENSRTQHYSGMVHDAISVQCSYVLSNNALYLVLTATLNPREVHYGLMWGKVNFLTFPV